VAPCRQFQPVRSRTACEPYGPKDGVLHTLNLLAAPRGLPHVMIEMRNDLIAEERGQDDRAERLSDARTEACAH
jgi:predicted N-formylglutamate amidohydrolase